MVDLVLSAPPAAALAIDGSGSLFPVRRVLCIGRNYAAHVREMGGDPKADPPIFFAKFPDSLIACGGAAEGASVPYPPATANLHHEIELVVALKGGGADLTAASARALIWGYAVGVDLTRRDLQNQAKDAGGPWEAAKAFDAAAPIGLLRPAEAVGDLSNAAIRLSVNGAVKQSAKLSDMIWNVGEVIAEASRLWRLEAGDILFTGTPEGVGPLVRGDRVEGEVEGVGRLAFAIG